MWLVCMQDSTLCTTSGSAVCLGKEQLRQHVSWAHSHDQEQALVVRSSGAMCEDS